MLFLKYFFIFCTASLLLTACTNNELSASPANTQISHLHEIKMTKPAVQTLIADALHLSKQKLDYQFGSADPKNGGLDCSGTIYYLLQNYNFKNVPRQSDQIYRWTKKYGKLHAVKSRKFNNKEFAALKPGDLLFWTGTYPVKRKHQITHVMLYLGKNKEGQRLMFGAHNRRTAKNQENAGVGVFAFNLPPLKSKSRFIGYACIPNLNC